MGLALRKQLAFLSPWVFLPAGFPFLPAHNPTSGGNLLTFVDFGPTGFLDLAAAFERARLCQQCFLLRREFLVRDLRVSDFRTAWDFCRGKRPLCVEVSHVPFLSGFRTFLPLCFGFPSLRSFGCLSSSL